MLISEEYRRLNEELHQRHTYGAGGYRWADTVRRLMLSHRCETVLDYGCGRGTLSEALDFPIREYDPAVPGRDLPPEPADLVVCTDVIEHIEPECLSSVLEDLRRLSKVVALLNISTRLAGKTLQDGRNAHLLVKSQSEWHAIVSEYFSVQTWDLGKDEVVGIVLPLRTNGRP